MSTSATKSTDNQYEVVIIGAGLAGASLAIQLLQKHPHLKLCIFDKRSYPLKPATCKVGESTVELGAHYLAKDLGLEEHLNKSQIKKLGLRFFFEGDNKENISQRLEFGARIFSPTPSYQLDRGILENYLKLEIEKLGGIFFENTSVKSIEINSNAPHQIKVNKPQESEKQGLIELETKWLIDASGRTGILSNKVSKKFSTDHICSSAWWRVNKQIKVDEWGDEEWRNNHNKNQNRWLSTCHLTGKGYWVWIIPLSSGYTSIGIVADERFHKFSDFHTKEKAIAWLAIHEPELHKHSLENIAEIEDFLVMKNYSYKRGELYSKDRWASTGEAGVFSDPYYSPGTDFIAISNTYITDLISRDLESEPIAQRTIYYNDVHLKIFHSLLELYRNKYEIFGNPLIMPIKAYWDWLFYWNFLCRLFIEDKLCDLSFMAKEKDLFARLDTINTLMQNLFTEWDEVDRPKSMGGYLDLSKFGFLRETNWSLHKPHSPGDFDSLFKEGARILESTAIEMAEYRKQRTGLAIPKELKNVPQHNAFKSFSDGLEEFIVQS